MGIPLAFQDASLERLDEMQRSGVEAIVSGSRPILTMVGTVGAGKTYAAVVAAREYKRRTGKAAHFYSFVDLLERYRASYDQDRATETAASIDAEIRRSGLIVLDDLGKQKSTEWAESQLFRLIDGRWKERRPLVVTTNVPPDQFDQAVRSRLFDSSAATVVVFDGKDRRR